MRKLFLLLALCSCSMMASAQIKSNVLGLELGKHTRTQVDSVLLTMNMWTATEPGSDGSYSALVKSDNEYFDDVDVKMAGVVWKHVNFYFHNDTLRAVRLWCDPCVNDALGASLFKKYSRYITRDEMEARPYVSTKYRCMTLTDGVITINLGYNAGSTLYYESNALAEAEKTAASKEAEDDL